VLPLSRNHWCKGAGWGLTDWEQLCGKVLGGHWEAQAEHEPAACPDCRDGQQHPGQYSQGYSQDFEGHLGEGLHPSAQHR